MSYDARRVVICTALLLTACGSRVPASAPGAPGPTPASPTPVVAGTAEARRGWDESFVYIGVTTQKDVQAAASSIGADGLDAGDQEGQALAVADELNRRGGLLGRRIKVVFRDLRTIDTVRDPVAAGNAACTYFTQDRPVVALVNAVTLLDKPSFRACLAKARVPLFSASVAAVDRVVSDELAPYFYQSVAPTWDALAPVLAARLRAQGWFGGWNPGTGSLAATKAKVGVLVVSEPVGRRVGAAISRALAGVGHGDAVTYEYAKAGDLEPAVLQFAADGVTHVIASNTDLLSFQLAASSQRYRPRYGVTSINAPQVLAINSPPGQNVGAMGVGWSPSLDVRDADDPGDTGPGETECRAILAKGGHTFTGKRVAEAVAFAFCDGLRLVVAGAVAGGGLTGPQIYAGVLRVAPSFSSAFSFRSGLAPGRLYVPGGVRDLVWDTPCDCMKYAGGTTYAM